MAEIKTKWRRVFNWSTIIVLALLLLNIILLQVSAGFRIKNLSKIEELEKKVEALEQGGSHE